jgi:anti-sigma B factor antagonist
MACRVSVRQVGGISVVELSGRITLGDGSGTVRETVKDLVEKEHKNILLDLGGVNYIDSAGLGELIGSYASVRSRGGEVKLLNTQKKVHDLLQITKLYTVFEVFTDEATALESFPRKAAIA